MKKIIRGTGLIMSLVMMLSIIDSSALTTTKANVINDADAKVNYIKEIIPEDQYSLKLKQMSDNKVKITLRNTGLEDIKNLQIDIVTDAIPTNTSLGCVKKDYDYTTIETAYTLHRGYSKNIVLEFADKMNVSDFSSITVCGERVFEEGIYDNIYFTTTANFEFTSEVIGNKQKILSLNENQVNEILVSINKVVGNEEYNYKGNVYVTMNGTKFVVDVTGDMFVSEEGILGTLVGLTDDNTPISFTINYTNTNENPYTYLAIGDVTVGDDFYFIYGNRKEENDELSDEKIKEEDELELEESQPATNCDSMVLTNDMLEIKAENDIINTSSEAISDYDASLQGMAWNGYYYEGKYYPLISTCLYSPSKQKSNGVYEIRGKVNEQMANADYYITTVCVNPGAVMSHSSTAKLEMYTKNKNVRMSELDPETTGLFTLSASIPVPYLSASFEYFNVSFPSISAKRYKINSSDKYNKAVWKFNDYISCSFSTNSSSKKYPTKIKKAYAGSCNVVYFKNKNAYYKLYCNGYVYYKGTIGLGHYRTDYSFNCSSGLSKKITTVPND